MLVSVLPNFALCLLVGLPWSLGWSTGAALVWSGVVVLVVAASAIVLHRVYDLPIPLLRTPWSFEDMQEQLSAGEVPKLMFPVRRQEGRLPYALLEPGFVLALTDRRVLAFQCDGRTQRIERRLWAGDVLALTVTEGGELELMTGGGESVRLKVPSGCQADVEYWVPRLSRGGS
ncbi:hypothetical protein [Streptomyces sp. YIM 130001]|uniref:hypothetical protein n=1 Tax=Streptomyces sp. YIM 130001 TaxID=2259644 RepID=UPI0013C4EC38|nr:hypothetical protein [Streptomyces sp. YIM 130001]